MFHNYYHSHHWLSNGPITYMECVSHAPYTISFNLTVSNKWNCVYQITSREPVWNFQQNCQTKPYPYPAEWHFCDPRLISLSACRLLQFGCTQVITSPALMGKSTCINSLSSFSSHAKSISLKINKIPNVFYRRLNEIERLVLE